MSTASQQKYRDETEKTIREIAHGNGFYPASDTSSSVQQYYTRAAVTFVALLSRLAGSEQ
jgi:hypothetical protein